MNRNQKITVIPGDGIGPDITQSVLKILDALDCSFEYEIVDAGIKALDQGKELIPEELLESIKRNKVILKGPLTTPIGKGFTSINVGLRKQFELFANVRPVCSFPNTKSRYENIKLVIIRENTEGLYCGEGQTLSEDGERAEAHSIVTRKGADRVLRFGFELAKKRNLKKVTVVHKANILKSTSGLFLEVARKIAPQFPDIEMQEMIVDNTCMQLVMNPHQFEVIVTTNLFGDILSDLAAGLVGGLGMAPGANIGNEVAMFEAVHGSAPDIAGKNVANPCSLLLAAAMMLDHLGLTEKADKIRSAIYQTLETKDRLTPDLGGDGGTIEFTDALIERLS